MNTSRTLSLQTLKEFKCGVFFETGTFAGGGVATALSARFTKIYSLEIYKYYYDLSSNMFKNHPDITIFFGDSSKELWDHIKNINEKICFWLDGHLDHYSPILLELDQIELHPIKNHTIMIDDIYLFGYPNGFPDITREDIITKLKEINPNYMIEDKPTNLVEKGCLVAYAV